MSAATDQDQSAPAPTEPKVTYIHDTETPVQMHIVYPGKPEAENTVVVIRVTRGTALQIINHRRGAYATVALFSGVDLNGNPYSVNVGDAAAAVYCEPAE